MFLSLLSFFVKLVFVLSGCKYDPGRSYHSSLCSIAWISIMHSYSFVGSQCLYVVFLCLYAITYNIYVCCLLFVVLPSFLACVVVLFNNCCMSLISFLSIWCLYSQFANKNQVVRIILISAVLFAFSFCRVTCSWFLSVCI